MILNEFYFTGTVISSPETKSFSSANITTFMVDQTTTFREKSKTTTLTLQGWSKGDDNRLSHLRIGDSVLVKGRITSSPFKDRFIMNLEAKEVQVIGHGLTAPPKEDAPTNNPLPEMELPF